MTFMIYISDVEAGGHTVFPNLGLSVPPVGGSALFWHTINSEVTPDLTILILTGSDESLFFRVWWIRG